MVRVRLWRKIYGASNSLGCERAWKALGETISKKRGKMEIHNAADQTLKLIWKVADTVEELFFEAVVVRPQGEG